MSKVRVVLNGCGGMSRAWLGTEAATNRVDIVGFVDILEDAAKKVRDEFNWKNARTGTNLAGMLEDLKPDAVFDVSVPEAHCEVTLTALDHGCHVLGEKPMASSMNEARRMVAKAKGTGKIYAVIQNRRYLPQIRRVRAFLESGVLGDIHSVHSDFFLGVNFRGFRAEMDNVLLLDMAIHSFDQGRLIMGSEAQSVYCREHNGAGRFYRHGACADALFEMKNGIHYSYRGSWDAYGCNTSWECDWRILGTKGSLLWDGGDQFKAAVLKEVLTEDGLFKIGNLETEPVSVPEFDAGSKVNGHHGLINEFLDCIESGGEPETICHDNIHSLAMVHAAIESARKGQRVEIQE